MKPIKSDRQSFFANGCGPASPIGRFLSVRARSLVFRLATLQHQQMTSRHSTPGYASLRRKFRLAPLFQPMRDHLALGEQTLGFLLVSLHLPRCSYPESSSHLSRFAPGSDHLHIHATSPNHEMTETNSTRYKPESLCRHIARSCAFSDCCISGAYFSMPYTGEFRSLRGGWHQMARSFPQCLCRTSADIRCFYRIEGRSRQQTSLRRSRNDKAIRLHRQLDCRSVEEQSIFRTLDRSSQSFLDWISYVEK